MDIKIYQSASDLDQNAWNTLDPFPRGTRAWFKTCEAYFQSTHFFYLTAWDDGTLRAILPLYDSFISQYYNVTLSFPGITQRLLQQQSYLCIGSPKGFEAEVIGDPRYTAPLLDEAVALAASLGKDYVCANFCQMSLAGWEVYRVGVVYNTHMLRMIGDSHNDFLAQFRAKRRWRLRQEMEKARPVFEAPLAGNETRFNALCAISCRRQGGGASLDDSFYTHLARTHGDHLVLTAIGSEDEWVGANLMISTPTEFCGMGIGLRERDGNYFNLMVHEPIQRAYATGRRQIDLGPACDEAKRCRGAEPIPLTAYLRPVSRRCNITINGVRPFVKFSSRLLPRIRRRLGLDK